MNGVAKKEDFSLFAEPLTKTRANQINKQVLFKTTITGTTGTTTA